MARFDGTYCGIVRENRDPNKLGRLKVEVAAVYGVASSNSEAIGVDNLPWALPAGLPAGASPDSGGIDWLPEPGDQVYVRFLDGDPEKPIWEWATQSIDQAKGFELHQYDAQKSPKRAGLTRYGHTLDFTDGAIVLTTKGGYAIAITDGEEDGSITITTALGFKIELNDELQQLNVETPAGQSLNIDDDAGLMVLNASGELDIQATNDVNVQADNMTLEALGDDITVTAPTSLTLTAGGATLAITDAGFDFTG